MFRRLTPFALGAVLAVVLSLAGHTPARGQAGQPAAYALTDLGAIASGPSTAADISPAGNVTGGVVVSAGTAAALWTPGSGGYTFQNLGLPSGSGYSPGYGANNSGQLAVTAGHSTSGIMGIEWENGFLWSGKWTDLTSKTKQSEAVAINAAGLVVGTAKDSQGHYQATL